MRELIAALEEFKDDPDPDVCEFHCTVVVWKDGHNAYISMHPGREPTIDIESFDTSNSELIDPRSLYGTWHSGLTEAPMPLPHDSYRKAPPLSSFHTFRGIVGDLLVQEAEIFEFLKDKPHPNICIYYGCVRDGENITALCLKRYERTLGDAMMKSALFDRKAALQGIRAGVDFLHSLGLVHGDLNPTNIMLDENGTAVIIDFDSCLKEGEKVERKGGTFQWCLDAAIAGKENDFYSLGLIEKFLIGGYVGPMAPPV